jgi:transposase
MSGMSVINFSPSKQTPKKVGAPPRWNQLSESEKLFIISERCKGASFRCIATELGRSHSTVGEFYHKFVDSGSLARRPGSGRPMKLSPRARRLVVRLVLNDRDIILSDIQDQLGDEAPSSRTLSTVIHAETPLFSGPKIKKPFINARNRKARVDFALKHLHWTTDDWKRVVFSDESPFVLRFNRRTRCWRLPGEKGNPQTIFLALVGRCVLSL